MLTVNSEIPQNDTDSRGRDYETPLLQAHFARIAKRLEAEGEAARSFDQGTNRGQIREAFIRELLSHNTSPFSGIGTGEIIHSGSTKEKRRRQLDVVIHNNRYPKISLATGIDLFFIETVSSFVEIKSRLTKAHIRQAAVVSKEIKANAQIEEQRFNPTGMVRRPRPYSFVFAYDGPAKITTTLNWMKEISSEDEYNIDGLKGVDGDSRDYFDHLFIDGVFILGRGFVCLDSLPFESRLQAARRTGISINADHIWVHGEDNELIFLWILINVLSEKYHWNNIELGEYLGIINFGLSD